jgi:hypothetical protein
VPGSHELTRDQAAALVEVTVEDFKDGRGENSRDVRRVKFKWPKYHASRQSQTSAEPGVADPREMWADMLQGKGRARRRCSRFTYAAMARAARRV